MVNERLLLIIANFIMIISEPSSIPEREAKQVSAPSRQKRKNMGKRRCLETAWLFAPKGATAGVVSKQNKTQAKKQSFESGWPWAVFSCLPLVSPAFILWDVFQTPSVQSPLLMFHCSWTELLRMKPMFCVTHWCLKNGIQTAFALTPETLLLHHH